MNEQLGLTRRARRALVQFVRGVVAAVHRSDGPAPMRVDMTRVPMHAVPAMAAAHRVEGCVHEGLLDLPGVDRGVLAALGEARQRVSRQHLRSVRSMRHLGAVLDHEGIDWLVFKGPVLSADMYRDPGLRSYGDLDVLVPQRDFARAVDAMESAGYTHQVRNWNMVRLHQASELALFDPDEITIDLHWQVVYTGDERRRFRIVANEMFERARQITVSGTTVRTFDEVDTLLHLALHTTRSGGHRLIWMKDLERALAVDQPDLDELVRRVTRDGCALPVGLALHRTSTTLGVDVPTDVIRALVGAPMLAVERLLQATGSPAVLDTDKTLPRLLSRSAEHDLVSTGVKMARSVFTRTSQAAAGVGGRSKWDPDNPQSLFYEDGDLADKGKFLADVSRAD